MEPLARLDQTHADLRRARELLASGEAHLAVEVLAAAPAGSGSERDAIRREIARAEALLYAGQVEDALGAAQGSLDRALAQPAMPEAALALAVVALCRLRSGDADDRSVVRREIEQALDPLPAHAESVCRLHQAHSIVLIQLGEPERARIAALRGLHAARHIDDHWREAMLLDTLGNLHVTLGDDLQAVQRFDDSLAIKRAIGDRLGTAVTLGGRGRTLLRSGDARGALEAFDESLEISRVLGNVSSEVTALDLGVLALLELDQPREARTRLALAFGLADRSPGEVTDRQRALLAKDAALIDEREGDRDGALRRLAEAQKLFASRNVRDGAGFCASVGGRILFRANELRQARALYLRAQELLHHHPRVDLQLDVLVHLVEVDLALGNEAEAETHLSQAERLAETHALRGWRSELQRLRRPADEMPERIVMRNELGLAGTEREYVLVEKVDEGAQGAIWRALDARAHVTVALKTRTLAENADDAHQAAEWWRTEIRAAAAVDHPGVVRVLGYQRIGATQYLVLEWIEGLSLRRRLGQGPVPIATGRRWIHQIAEGLTALHGGGVVHRDLKPENVMLRDGEDPVLLDFGAARLGPAEESEAGMLFGTPGYVAPEMIMGSPASEASDLFGLGLVATEILTAFNPFHEWAVEGSLLHYVERMRDAKDVERVAADAVRQVEGAAPDLAPVLSGLLSTNTDARRSAAATLLRMS